MGRRYNMKQWISQLLHAEKKTALPILAFPGAALMGISVKELVCNSELQAEGMEMIAKRTKAAASVSFMDLSVEAECFGAAVRFSDHEVPAVTGRLIHDMNEAQMLKIPDTGGARTGIYLDAVAKAVRRIKDRPVLAGMIGPYSLAARLLDVTQIMMDCYDDPDMVHLVLEKVTAFLIAYAKAYKASGAHGIMMAEPVAGLLSPKLEARFSAPYVKQIVDAVQDDSFIVIYHNCGDNTPVQLPSILSTGAAAYHFGNRVDLRAMLEKIPSHIPVLGNLDPAGVLRFGTPLDVQTETRALLENCGSYGNFVVSSGCDIPPLTPWENVEAFFAAVEEYYAN